jgi:hypothetical protein
MRNIEIDLSPICDERLSLGLIMKFEAIWLGLEITPKEATNKSAADGIGIAQVSEFNTIRTELLIARQKLAKHRRDGINWLNNKSP